MSADRSIVLLCGEEELDKERRGFARAFEKVAPLRLVPPSDTWLESIGDVPPLLILNPDGRPWLPGGIERVGARTAVFHIDTYVVTKRRIRWSAMYDDVFVFHPGFDRLFQDAGIPGARLLPHAVERELFDRPEGVRRFEVGWVGRAGRSIYGTRSLILNDLVQSFVTNDVDREYTPEEMADIYCASKVVVNVSRDDWPRDANMRCFEAMASGALLVTQVPTELTDLGFEENVHFAGWRKPEEVSRVVARWLANDEERESVAGRARELVLREHTYDARVRSILPTAADAPIAPARSWPAAQVQSLRLEYNVEYARPEAALQAFRRLFAASPFRALRDSWRMGRLAAKLAKRQWRRWRQ